MAASSFAWAALSEASAWPSWAASSVSSSVASKSPRWTSKPSSTFSVNSRPETLGEMVVSFASMLPLAIRTPWGGWFAAFLATKYPAIPSKTITRSAGRKAFIRLFRLVVSSVAMLSPFYCLNLPMGSRRFYVIQLVDSNFRIVALSTLGRLNRSVWLSK